MGGSVGPSALWDLTRGTGAVSLVLLTTSVAIGVANVRRVQTEQMPRFVVEAVHRSVSLLALGFLLVHIVTSVLDPFAPIRVIDAVVPFVSAYRPVRLGLGTIASDLLIAVAFTSVLRRRFGHRPGARRTGLHMRAGRWHSCTGSGLAHPAHAATDRSTFGQRDRHRERSARGNALARTYGNARGLHRLRRPRGLRHILELHMTE